MSGSNEGKPRKTFSHRKASSESVGDLNGTTATRACTKSLTNQSSLDNEIQKEPKHHRKGTQSAGASITSEEDESLKENALEKAKLLARDKTITDRKEQLAGESSNRKKFEQAYRSSRKGFVSYNMIERDLNLQLKNMHGEFQDLRKEYPELEDRIEVMTEENKELRAQWIGAAEELGRLQKTDRKHHTDDETVMAICNNLVCTIHTLSMSVNGTALVAPTPDQRENLGFIAPYFEKYFQSHPSVLFEAYIWSRFSCILNAPSMIWSQEAGRAVGLVTNPIICNPNSREEDVSRSHQWRADTNCLLHDYRNTLVGLDERAQETLIQDLCLPFKQCYVDIDHGRLITELRGIMQKMVEFCSTTARAKASYVSRFAIDRPFRPMKFREDIMEFKPTTSPKHDTIDFIISPCLVKYGNSDSENYDQRAIIDEARVAVWQGSS